MPAYISASTCFCDHILHAAIAAYEYVSNSGSTYLLNISAATYEEARASCDDNGAYLTSFLAQSEQAEVEQHYISSGFLIPTFHKAYWMGLRVRGPERPMPCTAVGSI